MSEIPKTPQSESFEELGFEYKKKMVGWFDPLQLADTGIKAVLSSIFGAYADKREVQAALSDYIDSHDYSQLPNDAGLRDEMWIDFMADTGDGFDSTYTVARVLAASEWNLAGAGGKTYKTKRGNVLIMGGDEVYPTSTRAEYRDRLVGPFRSALPHEKDTESAPHLYAIPGNHDWYDGLTSFTRLFFQKRWIGGWQTQQKRSYFALKLPHRWWLLGIDIQLDSDIDMPQLEYFKTIAEQFQEGDRIILCTAQPDWVYSKTKKPDAFQNLAYFERNVINARNAELVLTLTGDLHHYIRYENAEGGKHKFTAGGGGAYLYPTHHMPRELQLDETVAGSKGKTPTKTTYKRKAEFPSARQSAAITAGAMKLPFHSKGFWALLSVLYALYAWVVESANMSLGKSLIGQIQDKGLNFFAALEVYAESLLHSPSSMIFTLVIFFGLLGFASSKNIAKRVLIGGMHGLLHILLAFTLMWGFTSLNGDLLDVHWKTWGHPVLLGTEIFVFGGLLGCFLMGFYLFIGSRFFGMNDNESFSCQSIADYKNLLRLHLDANGNLAVYPLGITRVPKKWTLNTDAANGEPWFEPADGTSIKPELIEDPIFIQGDAGRD